MRRAFWCCIMLGFIFSVSHTFAQVVVNGKNYSVQQCIDMAKAAESEGKYREATIYLNSAAFYVWDNRSYDEAIDYFNYSIKLNQKIDNISGIAGINNNLGMLYADKGDYEESVAAFKKTLATRQSLKDKVPVVSAMINIAVVLNNLKRYDESIAYLEDALILSGEIDDKDQLKACYGLLFETYEKKGDQRKAMQYFELYRTVHEIIQKNSEMKAKAEVEKSQFERQLAESQNKNKELELILKSQELNDTRRVLGEVDSTNRHLQTKASEYELEVMNMRQQQRIKELEQKELESRLSREKTVRWVAIGGLALMIIFAAILFSAYRQKKKMNKLLSLRNEQIIAQAKTLREENTVRTKLLSVISHDLRSPLSSVHLMIQLLKVNTFSPEKAAAYLSKLDDSLYNTFSLLDNLLFWAKSQLNGIHPTPEVFDFSKLVVDNIKLLGAGLQNKEITLVNEVGEHDVYVDKEIAKLVLRNLLSNALKFTPKGGTISVYTETKADKLVVAVKDTGVGIPRNQQDKVFTTKVTTTNGTQNEPSSGLGLVLCKDFAEKNGGEIWFESEEGKGSAFYFTLLLSKETEA